MSDIFPLLEWSKKLAPRLQSTWYFSSILYKNLLNDILTFSNRSLGSWLKTVPLSEKETGISNSYLICLGKDFLGVAEIKEINAFKKIYFKRNELQSFAFTENE